jgi:hypothetical protein
MVIIYNNRGFAKVCPHFAEVANLQIHLRMHPSGQEAATAAEPQIYIHRAKVCEVKCMFTIKNQYNDIYLSTKYSLAGKQLFL